MRQKMVWTDGARELLVRLRLPFGARRNVVEVANHVADYYGRDWQVTTLDVLSAWRAWKSMRHPSL